MKMPQVPQEVLEELKKEGQLNNQNTLSLEPGNNNPAPEIKKEYESKPATGEWFEGILKSANIGQTSKGKDNVYGLIEMDVNGNNQTFTFQSYRSFIILQILHLKAEGVFTNSLNYKIKVQGKFKPKYNDVTSYMLFAEDMEIEGRSDLRTKAYAKEEPKVSQSSKVFKKNNTQHTQKKLNNKMAKNGTPHIIVPVNPII